MRSVAILAVTRHQLELVLERARRDDHVTWPVATSPGPVLSRTGKSDDLG
jgi:hypothetical protein